MGQIKETTRIKRGSKKTSYSKIGIIRYILFVKTQKEMIKFLTVGTFDTIGPEKVISYAVLGGTRVLITLAGDPPTTE